MNLAAAVTRLGTESAFEVLARARALEAAGREILHLEIGEPDAPTAPHVVEAGIAALRAGDTGYQAAAGTPELRAAAARHLARTRGIPDEPEAILVGTGAKPFLLFTVLATCEPGDRVVIPDPAFPIYASAVRWAGAEPVPVPPADVDALAAALADGPVRLVMLNSPHNPTGAMLEPGEVEAAAALIAATDAWVLSDEVYAAITYGAPAASVAALPGMLERTVVLDSMSKTYAMTGWRCGFAAVPEPLRETLTRFAVNSTSCVPGFVQRAAVAALEGPQDSVEAMVASLAERRRLIVDGLNAIPGVRCADPPGAFYAFPDVSGLGLGDAEVAARLLDEAGVAVLAGSGFGPGGEGHVRVSYATAADVLERALERISAWVDRR